MKYIFSYFLCAILFVACSDNSNKENSQTQQSASQSSTMQELQDEVKEVNLTLDSDSINNAESSTLAKSQNEKGADLYARCAACHGKDGKSIAPGSVGAVQIALLNKQQVVESLKGFRAKTLSKGGNSVIMYMQTQNLSDDDIDALAEYINNF